MNTIGSSKTNALIHTPTKVRGKSDDEAEEYDLPQTASFEVYSPGIYLEIDDLTFSFGAPADPTTFPTHRGHGADLTVVRSEIFVSFTQFYDEAINLYMVKRFQGSFPAFFSEWPRYFITQAPLVTSLPADGLIHGVIGDGGGVRADLDDPNGQWLARNSGLLPATPTAPNTLSQSYIGNRVTNILSASIPTLGFNPTYQAVYFGYNVNGSFTGGPGFLPLAGASINIVSTGGSSTTIYGQAPRVLKAT